MIFIEERLLDCVSYGSEFGQEFNTRIVTLQSGVDRRNAQWSAPLGRYSILYNALMESDHQIVRDAHMACMGSAIAFRLKDWTDYLAHNQFIGTGTGDMQTLQCIKQYEFGPVKLTRKIHKLVSAKVFADNIEIPTTIIKTTGEVIIDAPVDSRITWSGEFDVPVRFNSDRLDWQPVSRSGGKFILSSDVDLTEVRL